MNRRGALSSQKDEETSIKREEKGTRCLREGAEGNSSIPEMETLRRIQPYEVSKCQREKAPVQERWHPARLKSTATSQASLKSLACLEARRTVLGESERKQKEIGGEQKVTHRIRIFEIKISSGSSRLHGPQTNRREGGAFKRGGRASGAKAGGSDSPGGCQQVRTRSDLCSTAGSGRNQIIQHRGPEAAREINEYP